MVRITQSQLDMLSAGQTPAKPKRKHKFNAQKACVDGIKFDSRKEAARYQELKLQQHCGLISGLKLQPEFVLLDAFTSHGKKIRAIKYRADFQYEKEGETVVEDVKGHKTKEYLLKRKMFLRRYPEYRFLES